MTAIEDAGPIAQNLRFTPTGPARRKARFIIHAQDCHALANTITAPVWTWAEGRPLWEVRLKIRENGWRDCQLCYPTEVEKRRIPYQRR